MSSPDPLEEKLLSLRRRSLPPEWRAQILGQAARPRFKGPPRWLAYGWGAGIAAAVIFHLTTPTAAPSTLTGAVPESDASRLRDRAALLNAWLAANDSSAYPKP